jgi:hypothetical protein
LLPLAQGLSAVAARLEPKEAAEVAAALTQAISKTTGPYALGFLAQGLAAVTARLEPKEAARLCGPVAATLTQTFSKPTDPLVLGPLAQGLAAVAARLGPQEAAELAATLTQAISKADWSVVLPFFAEGLSAALARELPPQTLVDLLKHPFCLGEPRRLVLDQLARGYHRPFADQWDFVDYVQQQKLGLDLTTPPARQNPVQR